MIFRMLRGALVLATASVIVPYTVALLGNILYGWPQGKNKYKRALNPRKVYGVNYVIYQMLRDKSKFIALYFKWRKFYQAADPRRLYKNIAYGRNDCTLDVYLNGERSPEERKPVVIFVYGGGWSSGDKSSYGLLCSNIVKCTNTVAVCPNYSNYPKGYVDDMVQDIVDCICWVIENIQVYGGDKDKIVLMGHSSGAHLAAMSILELLHDERTSIKSSFRFRPPMGGIDGEEGPLAFAESHYGRMSALDRARDGLGDSSGSSESFAVVSDNGAMGESGGGSSLLEASTTSEGFVSMDSSVERENADANNQPSADLNEVQLLQEEPELGAGIEGGEVVTHHVEGLAQEGGPNGSQSASHSGSLGDDEEEPDEDSGDNDSVITVRPKDIDRHTTLVDLCKSVRAFIGLAGVYSISDHFKHEFQRGVEDMSIMCRAHYGEDHFYRFSPKEIVRSLGRCLRNLPLMVLVHGQEDYINPMSSSLTFGEALAEISIHPKVRIIPECPHYELCLDLMDRHRKFYSQVMNIVMETVKSIS
ncbi:hypothetical protein RRG08_022826 [Elysia crispata]|uniref:BD-FAE-like domain-containing protein n=1 Tax=Elysia crispata TaxID=231223 RepID=A0AAE0Z294_9GAST|nr:hypothetical protein RRG08_022826 [Elysia crispata]